MIIHTANLVARILRQAVLNGDEIRKPGWARLNFCVLMHDDKVDFIIRSVDELARNPTVPMQAYMCDTGTARFRVEQAPWAQYEQPLKGIMHLEQV